MKKVMKSLSVMLLMVALGMSLGSCGDDDHPIIIDTTGSGGTSLLDPEGTITVDLKAGEAYELSRMMCNIIYEDNRTMRLVAPLAPYRIASVGKVAGLGFINTIPEQGWSESIAVVPGNGYVIRYDLGAGLSGYLGYYRLYVVGYNANGITIKYQVWNGTPQQ